MLITVHFPKYYISLLAFPFSVLHKKPLGLSSELPHILGLYSHLHSLCMDLLDTFHLSIFEVAKCYLSEIEQPNQTGEDTHPFDFVICYC